MGTGAAGLIGSLLYLLLTANWAANLAPSVTLYIMCALPPCMLLRWVALRGRKAYFID